MARVPSAARGLRETGLARGTRETSGGQDQGDARGGRAASPRGTPRHLILVEPQNLLDIVLSLPIRRNPTVSVHRPVAGIVRGQREHQFAALAVEQTSEVPDASVDVLEWIERVPDAKKGRGLGHELHQAPRAFA